LGAQHSQSCGWVVEWTARLNRGAASLAGIRLWSFGRLTRPGSTGSGGLRQRQRARRHGDRQGGAHN
jgi:hypothetical protein